jgi:hypothetical protein
VTQLETVLHIRVSEALLNAIRARADTLHVRIQDVARIAIAEAVAAPIERDGNGHDHPAAAAHSLIAETQPYQERG